MRTTGTKPRARNLLFRALPANERTEAAMKPNMKIPKRPALALLAG
jgi:hypothetical protein